MPQQQGINYSPGGPGYAGNYGGGVMNGTPASVSPGAAGQYPPGLIQALSQPGYLQGVSGYNPSTYGASYANYDPAQIKQLQQGELASLSPQATEQQLLLAMQPQEQQGYQQLNQSLADFGVGGGQAVQANQQLGGEYAGQLAPAMASAIQNAQANRLGAGEFNVGQENQGRQFNAQNALQAALSNAGFANQAGQFNAGATNAAGQFNAQNANAANQYNVGVQNQQQQMLMNAILGNYANMMQNQYGLSSGLQQGLTQQGLNYGQDITTQNPLGAILGAAGFAGQFFGVPDVFGGGGGGGLQGAENQGYGPPEPWG